MRIFTLLLAATITFLVQREMSQQLLDGLQLSGEDSQAPVED